MTNSYYLLEKDSMLQYFTIIPCAFILFSFGFTLITVAPVFAQTPDQLIERVERVCPNHTNNNAPKVTANKKATCHRWSGWGVCIDPPTKRPAATCYNKSRDGYWDRVGREKGLPPCKETPPPVDRIHKYTQKCLKKKIKLIG